MPEQSNSVSSKPLPRVGHRPKRNLAWVWLIPIVAAVVGVLVLVFEMGVRGLRRPPSAPRWAEHAEMRAAG